MGNQLNATLYQIYNHGPIGGIMLTQSTAHPELPACPIAITAHLMVSLTFEKPNQSTLHTRSRSHSTRNDVLQYIVLLA
jgi:hypothetical protein